MKCGPPEVKASFVCGQLQALGYDFFCGVPCSLLAALVTSMESSGAGYYPASREDLALGLAAGAALAGHRPVVLMQNSGLGLSINALLSLHKLYQLTVLLIISWRGEGPDAPEHRESGRAFLPFLQLLAIPYAFLDSPDAFSRSFHHHPGPIALIVRSHEVQP